MHARLLRTLVADHPEIGGAESLPRHDPVLVLEGPPHRLRQRLGAHLGDLERQTPDPRLLGPLEHGHQEARRADEAGGSDRARDLDLRLGVPGAGGQDHAADELERLVDLVAGGHEMVGEGLDDDVAGPEAARVVAGLGVKAPGLGAHRLVDGTR